VVHERQKHDLLGLSFLENDGWIMGIYMGIQFSLLFVCVLVVSQALALVPSPLPHSLPQPICFSSHWGLCLMLLCSCVVLCVFSRLALPCLALPWVVLLVVPCVVLCCVAFVLFCLVLSYVVLFFSCSCSCSCSWSCSR
jgi:hypothetical protein